MMILPFSARLRGTLFTLTLTLLSGCALIQDEPAQVAIVNPQQAPAGAGDPPGEQRLAGRPLVGGL